MTLVEVLASLVLMGVLLSGILLAKARHTAQLVKAERKIAAVRVADELLSQWSASGAYPVGFSGSIAKPQPMRWVMNEHANEALAEVGLKTIRLTVYADTELNSLDAPEPLATVDLAIPIAMEEENP